MMRYESNVPFVETGGAFSVELSRDNFIKRTWGIFLLFFGGIFTMAGTMLAISVAKPSNFDVFYDSQDVMHLHTSMFFCMTSLLTVNHGDIIPSTTVSRVGVTNAISSFLCDLHQYMCIFICLSLADLSRFGMFICIYSHSFLSCDNAVSMDTQHNSRIHIAWVFVCHVRCRCKKKLGKLEVGQTVPDWQGFR